MLTFVDQQCFGREACRVQWNNLPLKNPGQTECTITEQYPYADTDYLCLNKNNFQSVSDIITGKFRYSHKPIIKN